MTEQTYLAVDLGAESGRVMAGHFDGRVMRFEEIHRFPNGPVRIAGRLRWGVARLWDEIQNGLRKASQRLGRDTVRSVGVDGWGVDYVLLSKAGEVLGLPFNYRDPRTAGLIETACRTVPRETIFAETGLQFMEINSLYQLLAHQRDTPGLLQATDSFLMIPDFMNWCLCGRRAVEFTNATTSQLLHPSRRDWSDTLIEAFGLPRQIFPEIVFPGDDLGPLSPDVAEFTGLGAIRVVAPATHDTGSAVVAVPTSRTGQPDWCYVSSGTWSLIGLEVNEAVLSPQALAYNVTNEGGVDGTYRLLKNVMGLWLVQQLRKSFESAGQTYSYDELHVLAEEAPPFAALVDPDDPTFLAPANMEHAIREACSRTGQAPPESKGELVRCAIESLALKYRVVLRKLEELTGTAVKEIHVVGGGSRNTLLNQFTADACGRPVIAGPVEATALGNLLIQARAAGEIGSLAEIREVVRSSSELRTFEPQNVAAWNEAADRFAAICAR